MSKFDMTKLDDILFPIWDGNEVYEESVLFFEKGDVKSLLYRIDEIVSVKTMTGEQEFTEGKDYELVDGKIRITENSTMPYMTRQIFYDDPSITDFLLTYVDGKLVPTYWGEGTSMTKYQVKVTYKHSQKWNGPDNFGHRGRFERFIGKLERGEDVTVLFYGDSITAGGNASAYDNVPPYMPTWAELVCLAFAKKYNYTVHYIYTDFLNGARLPKEDTCFGDRGVIAMINTAVCGWSIGTGIDNFEVHGDIFINKYGCDLLVLAYGMNDKRRTAQEEYEAVKSLANMFLEKCDASTLFVSTMLPNPEANERWNGPQVTFEPEIMRLADEMTQIGHHAAVAPVTSVSKYVLTRKRFRDYSANNINHPNDFFIRVYASVILKTLLE